MTWYRSLTLAVVLPLGSACHGRADDAAAIRAAREAQNAAIARRDYTAIAQRWTEDITGPSVQLAGFHTVIAVAVNAQLSAERTTRSRLTSVPADSVVYWRVTDCHAL